MVKIRLLDEEVPNDDQEAFLTLERHDRGFAVVLVDSDGDKIDRPFILFLKTDLSGKLLLNLALSPSINFITLNPISNTIALDASH